MKSTPGTRLFAPMKVAFKETLTPKVLTEEEPVRGIDPPPFKFVASRARSDYVTRGWGSFACIV